MELFFKETTGKGAHSIFYPDSQCMFRWRGNGSVNDVPEVLAKNLLKDFPDSFTTNPDEGVIPIVNPPEEKQEETEAQHPTVRALQRASSKTPAKKKLVIKKKGVK